MECCSSDLDRCYLLTYPCYRRAKMRLLVLLASLEQTCAACCDQANFRSWNSAASRSCWVANVLMVSSSVRVFNWIHRRATNLWETVPLNLVLVMVGPGLQHWLLNASTASTNSNNGTA